MSTWIKAAIVVGALTLTGCSFLQGDPEPWEVPVTDAAVGLIGGQCAELNDELGFEQRVALFQQLQATAVLIESFPEVQGRAVALPELVRACSDKISQAGPP